LRANDLFTVVLEHFQTDTADYADFILPATTQLEHWDIHLPATVTQMRDAEPSGHCPIGPESKRSNAQIFRELAATDGLCGRLL
jgi:anaerobic selenocysteine-containing dehydrogenase